MIFYTFLSLIYTYEPILKFKLKIGRLFTFKRPFPLKMPLLGRYYLLSDQTYIGDNHLGVYQAYITFYNDEHKKERECSLSKKRFLLSYLLLRRFKHPQCYYLGTIHRPHVLFYFL